MLEIEALVVKYGPFLAVDGVNLRVETGEIVGLIGPNGAGKSSLVRAALGLVPPAAGRIVFEGQALGPEPPQERTRRGIALVPEGRGLFPRMSVEENLMMGGYPLDDRARVRTNMARSYEMFPVLAERRRQFAGTLSGGQQQMLAISMGMMADPRILILDEPSLGLAPIVIGEISRTLRRLKQDGMTVLLAEQNANLTSEVADRIYVMQSGRILYHDTPDKLLANPEIVESFLSI
jgi:branched-chain amino acid transport system ATP-binding protein